MSWAANNAGEVPVFQEKNLWEAGAESYQAMQILPSSFAGLKEELFSDQRLLHAFPCFLLCNITLR